MNKAELNDKIARTIIISVSLSGLLFLIVGVWAGVSISPQKEINVVCQDITSFENTLNVINKNCKGEYSLDSVYLTKEYPFEMGLKHTRWFVSLGNVCDGKKCEYKYVPIEYCLNEVRE